MSESIIRIKRLHPELGKSLPMPERMSAHASGIDVSAAIDAPMIVPSLGRVLVPCGFSMAVPAGYEIQVRPRSGLALKHGLTVLNTPGTIDADYRGEVKVLLVNLGSGPVTISPGQRIAQLVVAPVCLWPLEVVTELPDTVRGAGGFGSTGQ